MHRSHHRYVDTDRDPYNSKRGLLWTHLGWMLFKTDHRAGSADSSDLRNNWLVMWQHRWYFLLSLVWGFMIPTVIPGYFWGDWKGGVCFSGALRMTMAHHSVFCVNSIAHWLGDAPYDDRHTPRDHLVTAILTLGEGYHNFHHQFPMDYRNAYLWYQFDPTKWFIKACSLLGLANHLKVFPSNEVEKSAFTMKLKDLKSIQDSIKWPCSIDELPVVTWETFQKESRTKNLVLFSGFIHDVTDFVEVHPGGKAILQNACGMDITAAFFGGIYEHSSAAHNLLAMKRVGILNGGVESTMDGHIPPSQILCITDARRSRRQDKLAT